MGSSDRDRARASPGAAASEVVGWELQPLGAEERRPLRRDRRSKRAAPVIGAIVLGTAGAFLTDHSGDALEIGTAIGLFLVAIVSGLTVPWERFPRWFEMTPPLLFTVGVVVLREGFRGDATSQAYAPLLLIPLLGMAFQGNRAELFVQYVAAAAALLLPALWRPFLPGELGRHLVTLGVWAFVCISAREVVGEVRAVEGSFARLIHRLPIGVCVEHEHACRYANPQLVRMVGRDSPEALLGRPALDLVHPDDRVAVLETSRTTTRDTRLLRAEGAPPMIVETHTVEIEVENQQSILYTFHDVTDLRARESLERGFHETIALERSKLTAVLGRLEFGVALLDANRSLLYANEAYPEVLGLSADALSRLDRASLRAHLMALSDEPDEVARRFDELDFVGDRASSDFTLVRPARRILRRVVYRTNLQDSGAFVVTWQDVTAEHELITHRERLAMIDPLTGAPNRRGAEVALERELSRERRTHLGLCVAMIDIDHFKAINDTYGHAIGDDVIRRVVSAIAGTARSTDTVARWGGEEFLAVLPGPLEGAKEFCERIRALVSRLSIPGTNGATISIGLALHAEGDDAHATIARADEQLYRAKRSGRNRVSA